MPYKPEVEVEGKFYPNAQVFETEAEALSSAHALFNRWYACTSYRAVLSEDPVNYKRENDQDIPINRDPIPEPEPEPDSTYTQEFDEFSDADPGL
jgi:hypothetical protein